MQIYGLVESNMIGSIGTECFCILFKHMNYGSPMEMDEFESWLTLFVNAFLSMRECSIAIKVLLSVCTIEQYTLLLDRWMGASTALCNANSINCLHALVSDVNIKGDLN